jgi:hypothetical protein
MKYLSIIFLLSCFLLNSSMKQSGYQTSCTANLNGAAWKCTQVGVSLQSYTGNTTLMLHAQNPPVGSKIEYISFTLSSFSGTGDYAFGKKDDKGQIKVSYQSSHFSSNPKLNGGGSGTIKVTEYIKPPSPGKMGKIVGEISGTVKFGEKTLTVTNGKFISTAVL